MKLAVFSHKEVWCDPQGRPGYVTVGGFPVQMRALSQLFDETHILCALMKGDPPQGYQALTGPGLTVCPCPVPVGRGFVRKSLLPFWLLRHVWCFKKLARECDAAHAVLPGDLGVIGYLVGLASRKPIFARYCGMWSSSESIAIRLTKRLLTATAGGTRVVLATGGGAGLPSEKNSEIGWIFASSLSEEDWSRLPNARRWEAGSPLRLAAVGRLSKGKNFEACVAALPKIHERVPGSDLTLVGDGENRLRLEELAREVGVFDFVHFVGSQSRNDVLNILSKSNVFVFPSLSEGFPKAVVEAMACGLPVIANPVSVLPDLLAGGCGVLLRGSDARDVAEAVLELISDPPEMESMGMKARAKSRSYSLEGWRDFIRERLESAWGRELRADSR